MEMQALIAFACYDSPSIAQGGDSMNDAKLSKTMTDLYFGGNDPETISYLDQFIYGLHRFKGMFTSSEEPNEFGQIVLTMPQKLHRQHGGLNVFVGQKSITKELLSQKNFTNSDRIPGSKLLGKGKTVVKTCKKIMALVTASGSPYCDGTLPSGTNWDDYIKWCLVAMQNEYDRETKEKGQCGSSATTEAPATSTGDAATTETAAAAATTTTEATAAIVGTETAATTTQVEGMVAEPQDPLSPCADASFFKVGVGFLAWALWGHIPLNDGAQMVSKLFSNAKANTSYGRGTSTRSAMQNAVIAASAAPVDNRRGRGKKRDNNILNTNVSFSFDSLSNHVRQSNARPCLPFVVVVILHEITFEHLVINLAIYVETITFGERNFTTITTHPLYHVDREKS